MSLTAVHASEHLEKNTDQLTKIAVAYGDGIGPEIMDATLRILMAAGAKIDPELSLIHI